MFSFVLFRCYKAKTTIFNFLILILLWHVKVCIVRMYIVHTVLYNVQDWETWSRKQLIKKKYV